MKLRHKKPCSECPWRKTSLKGWLGGYSPYVYADGVANNEIPACHNVDFGPNDPRSSMCAGALATAKKSCVSSYMTPGADDAKKRVLVDQSTFDHYSHFYQYHAGDVYVPTFQRRTP